MTEGIKKCLGFLSTEVAKVWHTLLIILSLVIAAILIFYFFTRGVVDDDMELVVQDFVTTPEAEGK